MKAQHIFFCGIITVISYQLTVCRKKCVFLGTIRVTIGYLQNLEFSRRYCAVQKLKFGISDLAALEDLPCSNDLSSLLKPICIVPYFCNSYALFIYSPCADLEQQ